jgi:hypothetical protein
MIISLRAIRQLAEILQVSHSSFRLRPPTPHPRLALCQKQNRQQVLVALYLIKTGQTDLPKSRDGGFIQATSFSLRLFNYFGFFGYVQV